MLNLDKEKKINGITMHKQAQISKNFLMFMGEKVKLLGWNKFRGGLNNKDNATGTHSIYTQYHDFEIMFHVSTYLPHSANDPQQVEKKRHLGNDIVVILFRDENCTDPFDPAVVRSQFNHVFAIVQPETSTGVVKYKVAFASKHGVRPYGPRMPHWGVYFPDASFKNFFLTKLINGENAALAAPDFKGKMSQTRCRYLTALVQTVVKK